MSSKRKPISLVIVSDIHIGSTVGLCPPSVDLDDGGIYQANKLQTMAYEFWTKEFWPKVFKSKREIIVIVNGEAIDGDHHQTPQLWTRSIPHQVSTAVELFTTIRSRCNRFYVVRGSPVHVSGMGAADEDFARQLGADRFECGGTRSAYHIIGNIGGVEINIAHEGPNPGTRVWTFGNALRGYVRTIVLDAMIRKERPPDIVLRSHVHLKAHETVRDYGHVCEAIITPAWQWKTEYGHTIASHEDIADVGGTIIDIDDGKISDIRFDCLSLKQSKRIEI